MSSFPSASTSGSGSGLGSTGQWGIGFSNTIHSEVAPCLPLPSLPVFCGATDPNLRLFDEASAGVSYRLLNRTEILTQSSRIADLLRVTDVSYLNLRDEAKPDPYSDMEPLELHNQVLQYNAEAFEYVTPVSQVILRSKFLAVNHLKGKTVSQVYLALVVCREIILELRIPTSTVSLQMMYPLHHPGNPKSRRKVGITSLPQLSLILLRFKMLPL